MTEYKAFNAVEVPLRGSNLIEASAGTGKTYSLALLALRLILEERLTLKEILMVTFSKAAVAELAGRVRLFLRLAYKCSRGEDCTDATIAALVARAQEGENRHEVAERLRTALLFIDDLNVLTIHSFCQNTLSDFAFETAQSFAPEMLPSIKPLTADLFHKFWRKNINTLSPRLLRQLDIEKLREILTDAVESHMNGRLYFGFEDGKDYSLTSAEVDAWLERLEARKDIPELLETAFQTCNDAYKKAKDSGRTIRDIDAAKRAFGKTKKHFEAQAGNDIAFIEKNFPEAYPAVQQYLEALEARTQTFADIHQRLRYWAIGEILKNIEIVKKRSNLITFSDMITKLNEVITQGNAEALVQGLRSRYKAVFIDEYQDTDRKQYEIFHHAFGEDTILFLIGDPKQSIYGFRSADMYTYFEARRGVDNVYGMNVNYRSTPRLLEAMNVFFKPHEDFDTFHFSGSEDAFDYVPVSNPEKTDKEGLFLNGKPVSCIQIAEAGNANDVQEYAALQVADLLRNNYTLKDKNGERRLKPSDIGVLVRQKDKGHAFKERLASLGIPAVFLEDQKILGSPQATELVYLLQAIQEPKRANIHRALLCMLLPFTNEDLLRLNDEAVVSGFARYRRLWAEDGILPALMEFSRDFGLREFLTNREDGFRIYANYLQLAELLHETQSRRRYSEIELLSWLQRTIGDAGRQEGGLFIQRLERDDDAVGITTIHKSKGLEYPVVILPNLNWQSSLSNPNRKTVSYREPEKGAYFFIEKERLSEEQKLLFAMQEEQENRRLLYVAVTRAVYGCYLFSTTHKTFIGKTADTFMSALREIPKEKGLSFGLPPTELAPAENAYGEAAEKDYIVLHPPLDFKLPRAWWRRLSYTGLNRRQGYHRRPAARPQETDYDRFVYETLSRNSKTGEMLHLLLERALPDQPSNWPWAIKHTLKRYAPARLDDYLPLLTTLMQHLAGAEIAFDGQEPFLLKQVSYEKRLSELEFDFPVGNFRLPMLAEALSTYPYPVLLREEYREAEGVMNGKIDLFFEYNGRYYLLDWKSNYLGDSPQDYSAEAVEQAMTNENYHLQYLIYTLAVKKYLEQRLPGFDYERDFGGVIYVFVRGVRNGESKGIFTAKPTVDVLNRMADLFDAKAAVQV